MGCYSGPTVDNPRLATALSDLDGLVLAGFLKPPSQDKAETMTAYYLNTYTPLVASKHGRVASDVYGIPPFVDGSIRREPDLESPFPSISCLCRADKFAPRLSKGDVVGYMACKGRYGESTGKHHRLTAVLRVREVLPTHGEAASWYRQRGLEVPSNCMVPGNRPMPLRRSHRKHPGGGCGWDKGYRSAPVGTPSSSFANPCSGTYPGALRLSRTRISSRRFIARLEHAIPARSRARSSYGC